ncbi:MAG: 1,4-alpha-glucan-branching protein [Myxococcaceae bacterium]|nr:1,4-alpha-glucan-branching protein [Myxococcaceae bacterium]
MKSHRHTAFALFGLALLLGLTRCGGGTNGTTAAIATPPEAGTRDASDPGEVDGAAGDAGPPARLPVPRLGADVDASGVRFRVWAPSATAAWVTGDFPGTKAPLAKGPGDIWEAHVDGAHAGTHYKLLFDSPSGSITRIDPYCRELVSDGCSVVDPNAFAWKTPAFKRPTREKSVVYEMHLGSFTTDTAAGHGTIASAVSKLAALAELGVNVVELMPVHVFGGSNGWGYNPQLWLAPNPGLGTPAELRALVDEAHRLGIAVWIDLVVNHTDGWKNAPLRCFDGACPNGTAGVYFFPSGPYASTPWGPRPDYTQPEVASMLVASVEQWLLEYRGDGFRWDSTSNIRGLDGQGTLPGGRELMVRANARTHDLGGTSVAEDLKGWDALTKAESKGGFGFDAQWDGFGYDVPSQLVTQSDDARSMPAIESALRGSYDGDPFARLLFTENHDTVGNGSSRLPNRIDPANPTSVAARKRSMLGAVLLLTSPGVPMLFMGQESLATGTFGSPPTALAAPTPAGLKVNAFYKDMIALRRTLGGLADTQVEVIQRNDTEKVIAFRRHGASGEDVLVVVNMKNKAYAQYDVGVPTAGPWKVRLNTERAAYGDDLVDGQTGTITAVPGAKDGKPFKLPLQLGAYSAIVLTL